jgi:hypothetical protein
MFQQAVSDINGGKFVRAVTNANLTRDTSILNGVSENLKALGITFIDVMR